MNPFVSKYDFANLFTFEMANNHQGDLQHGLNIVKEIGKVAKEFDIKAAVKIQLRDLDTFIHPDYKDRKDVKHIPRFLSTRLSKEQFKKIIDAIKAEGMISMATPFDEASVDVLEELDVEIVKVASASALDFPLLERIAKTAKPIIVSVGGLEIKDIDRVVSFFDHRGADFALMHCVSIYPTPADKMFLKQIEVMKSRYPHLTIGFSTHESPENTAIIGLAYAKGARIFEKHVGIATDTIKLNAYSATPDQVRAWVKAYKEAVAACAEDVPRTIDATEAADLKSLKRGVFARHNILKGALITKDDVFFAMPLISDGQLDSGRFKLGLPSDRDYAKNEAISEKILPKVWSKKDSIYAIVREAKAMLNIAKVPLSHDFTVEISHHYGLERFNEIGCIIIDCINREYARKLIIQFPGQFHPIHYHKLKDESFHVLHGSMEAEIEGKKKMLYPGDTLWVPRGVWHSFKTDEGVIFEEISTTSMEGSGDSYYVDKNIAALARELRKTRLMNWGRHQFDNE